ncbi:MAG: aspartate/glutamate racemase family protein [Planctomycetota bacterium]|jgi:hypothetical protein
MKKNKYYSEKPVIGILGWEEQANESLYGSIANPDTFSFPVLYKRTKGACYETVISNPNLEILYSMIEVAKEMEAIGIRAITTSCGFNAIFQKELVNKVNIPVFASTLILVPLVYEMLNDEQEVGIITANKAHLTKEHLERSGITDSIPVCIYGLEHTNAFSNICLNPRPDLFNEDEFREEVINISRTMANNNNIGAIVLEMTVLHAFSKDIKKAINLPVFDIVTLTNFIFQSITLV